MHDIFPTAEYIGIYSWLKKKKKCEWVLSQIWIAIGIIMPFYKQMKQWKKYNLLT